MSAQSPEWVRFAPKKWLGELATLAANDQAPYLRLLVHMYARGGRLPDHDRTLADMAGVAATEWVGLKWRLLKLGKLVQRDGGITASGVEDDVEFAHRAERAKAARREGARKARERIGKKAG